MNTGSAPGNKNKMAEKLLAAVLFLALCAGGGFFAGYRAASNKFAARQLAAERAASAEYRAGTERGNASSARLAQAETRIQTRTVERIKYVPRVTSGRRCLDPAAVGLLNAAAAPGLPAAAAGQPAAADAAAPAASDTDVAGWIATASGQYETCAARLNGLVDYEEAKP